MNIVQIGCNDCQDHVLEYVLKHHKDIDKLILVDLNEDKMTKGCTSVYDQFDFDLVMIPKAITTQDSDNLILYTSSTDENGHHTSTNKQHLFDHHHKEEDISELVFPAININKLFEENNLTKIDRLYIDTEGYDIDIINSINFDRWDIPHIHFEVVHSDGAFSGAFTHKCRKCYLDLINRGYKIDSDGGDAQAVKQPQYLKQ